MAVATDGSGWTFAVLIALFVGRAMLRGDLVTGREYDRLARELERVSVRAEALTDEQRQEAATERGRLLDQIAKLRRAVEDGSA